LGTVAVVVTAVLSFGIIGLTLWRALNSPPPDPAVDSADPAVPAASPSPATPSPSPAEVNPYEAALETAQRASNLQALAQSVDDWNTIARQWQRAIALLQVVPEDSPDYAAAQAAIPEYQANLANAEQQVANAPDTDALPPPTTVPIGGDQATCPSIETTPDSSPLEFSQLSLTDATGEEGEGNTGNSGGSIITGCVTNHTDIPISDIVLTYEAASEQLPEFSQTGEQGIDVSTIPPGETVPFQSSFTLEPDATQVTITTVTWTPPEATEPEQISPGIAIAR
jgi:hypothetical protein